MATTEYSDLWKRLTKALREKGLPISQNGIATMLDMSQGSVRRWYTGEGLPELKTAIVLAERTGYSVEWILTGRGREKPEQYDDLTTDLLQEWARLTPEMRLHVLGTAKLAHAAQFTGDPKERDRVQREMARFTESMRSGGSVHDRRGGSR